MALQDWTPTWIFLPTFKNKSADDPNMPIRVWIPGEVLVVPPQVCLLLLLLLFFFFFTILLYYILLLLLLSIVSTRTRNIKTLPIVMTKNLKSNITKIPSCTFPIAIQLKNESTRCASSISDI